MITTIKTVRVQDLINLTLQGNLDLEKLKACLEELSSTHGLFTDYDLIIDSRGAEMDINICEFWYLAKQLANIIHSGSSNGFKAKIAVICKFDRFENAKFLELCSLNQGLNMRSFISFEELFDWMSNSKSLELENLSSSVITAHTKTGTN